MTSTSFANVFQARVIGDGFTTFSLEELALAYDESYLAQAELKEANVAKLVKDIVAKTWLIKHPILALVPSERLELIAGGRHRLAAVTRIIRDYGLNAKGKAVLRTDDNATELTDIEPEISVQVLTFASKADLVQFLQADNGSRSMTAYERALGSEYSKNITPLMATKLSIVSELLNAFAASSFVGVFTHATLLGMVTASFTAIGSKAKFISGDAQTLLVNLLVEAAEMNESGIDSNLARLGHKQIVDLALLDETTEVVLDADGDEIVNITTDVESGDEVESGATVAQWLSTQIVTPAKAPKKTKATEQVSKLEEQVAKLTAMLQAQGSNV